MAVRFDAAADQLSRTSDHVPSFDPITWSLWLYVISHQVALVGGLYNGTGTEYSVIGLSGAGVLTLTTVGGSPTGSTLTTGQWYHLAYVRNGSSHVVYLDGVADISHTDGAAVTPSAQVFGSNTSNNVNGRLAALKCWAAALSADDVAREMGQYWPIRLTGLHFWWPLLSHSDVADHSGNGRAASTAGTLTTEDGPPIPWRAGRPRILLPEPQRARPASDVTDGTWTTDTGGTALAAAIDEALPPSDSDYIQSALAPAADTAEVALGTLTDPSRSDGHVVRYRAVKPAAGRQIDLTVRLMQGTTEIAAWTTTDLATTIALIEQTLTTGQADAITNYADVRLRLIANQPAADPTAPTYVGVGTAAAVASGDYAPSWPTGGAAPVINDIAIMLGVQRDNVAEALPGGWTQIYSVNEGTTTRAWAYWFRCAGGESGTVTVTRAAGNTGYARIILIRGCPTSGSPIDASGTSGNTSNSTTITAPSITPTQANDLLLLVAHAADNGTNGVFGGTNPTPTEQFDTNTASGNDAGLALCSGVVPNTSATGSRTSTYTLSQRHVGATIAVKGAYAADARARVTWAELEVPAASGPGVTALLPTAALGALFPAAATLVPGSVTLAAAAALVPRPASAPAVIASATITTAAARLPSPAAAADLTSGTTQVAATGVLLPLPAAAALAVPGVLTLAPPSAPVPLPPAAASITASQTASATTALLPGLPAAAAMTASATTTASAPLPPDRHSGASVTPGLVTLAPCAVLLPSTPSASGLIIAVMTLLSSPAPPPSRSAASTATPALLTLLAAALLPTLPPAASTIGATTLALLAVGALPVLPVAAAALTPGLASLTPSAALLPRHPAAGSLNASITTLVSAALPPSAPAASVLALSTVLLSPTSTPPPPHPAAALVAPGTAPLSSSPALLPSHPAASTAASLGLILLSTSAHLPTHPSAAAMTAPAAILNAAGALPPFSSAATSMLPGLVLVPTTSTLVPAPPAAAGLVLPVVVLTTTPAPFPLAPATAALTPGLTVLIAAGVLSPVRPSGAVLVLIVTAPPLGLPVGLWTYPHRARWTDQRRGDWGHRLPRPPRWR